ncbi:MAG TPA: hypothetical protein VM260_22045 [Pirellula sp.]|nr:hypothetical protein [Pirellula sp.]
MSGKASNTKAVATSPHSNGVVRASRASDLLTKHSGWFCRSYGINYTPSPLETKSTDENKGMVKTISPYQAHEKVFLYLLQRGESVPVKDVLTATNNRGQIVAWNEHTTDEWFHARSETLQIMSFASSLRVVSFAS